MITVTNSGNCNFQYISGLMNYGVDSAAAMKDLLIKPKGYYEKEDDPIQLRLPLGAFYLFAQDSDNPTADNPYGPSFKKYIEDNGLGKVFEHTASNPAHGGRYGTLYVWELDRKAIEKWWATNGPKKVPNASKT